ncbi:hypothetical protein SIPHO4S_00018 [Serratia phage Tsm2]|uniref:Uncharacterized protein n=1 Tax=Serratia phage Tsm2 TaxID=2787014 RepID=A0A7S9SPT0_9CAUD|nr:hypothetical protein PF629_gp18 [Serratia phage Tsm2]QPI13714.1 hypothetical protein SIPHO4S_00018 [Serratia phage Tsm2]
MSDLDLAVQAAMFALRDEIEEKEDLYHDFVEGEDAE